MNRWTSLESKDSGRMLSKSYFIALRRFVFVSKILCPISVSNLLLLDRGERFVFGHHYLRPHETYHEPTRKFYENEVVCAPLYEAVPCDLVAERCWVLDPHTYCKGSCSYFFRCRNGTLHFLCHVSRNCLFNNVFPSFIFVSF